jgi:hypothetical protein
MSASIDGKTPVVLTMRQVVSAVAAVLVVGIGAFWALASWSSAGLRDDVTQIRKTLEALQHSDNGNALNIKQAEIDFSRQVDTLNLTLTKFDGRMDLLGSKLDTVGRSMDQLQAQMVRLQRPASIDIRSLTKALGQIRSNADIIVLPLSPSGSEPPKD